MVSIVQALLTRLRLANQQAVGIEYVPVVNFQVAVNVVEQAALDLDARCRRGLIRLAGPFLSNVATSGQVRQYTQGFEVGVE